jgi:hypothetical protein
MTGGRFALAATLAQLLAGVWVLLSLPSPARDRLLGDDAWTALLFATSLVSAVMLMHVLASLAQGEVQRRRAWMAAAWLVTVVLLMVAVQDRVRRPVYDRALSEYVDAPRLVH